ncbi:hypothetical protein AWB64_04865 [Caballeronia sordidicola]|uniref:Uncharacterized protein n=1 Tax=Caballeronia sordidicola TaxID=196367 RepID=A0A158HPY1_CABSO|nr:hypothetical protein [Caballeronia sordidicola]SAL46127.1 hypothetical protein AWB64_04865 [Caballeronia sordidicola]
MHTIALLRPDMFEVTIDHAQASIDALFPGWNALDRLGVVIDEPLGGLGASHLIQFFITAFYEARPRRRGELTVYPEIYAFHYGRPWGTHAAFDFWPARREVMVPGDPKELLDAINDRGITRLAVPDRAEALPEFRPKEVDHALDRIASGFAYHACGRVRDGDVTIRGMEKRTEVNPGRVLRPVYLDRPVVSDKSFKETDTAYIKWLKLRAADITPAQNAQALKRREAILCDGVASETYRRIDVMEALARMASGER